MAKPGTAELMRDHYDQHLRSANYLFVAHGAGLIGCLSALKNYQATPQFKGIGIFIFLFALGFMGAIFNYIGLVFARIVVMNAIHDEAEPDKITATFLGWVHITGLSIALLTLLIAVCAIAVYFVKL